MSLKEAFWEELFFAINEQKCTPFIGAGACVPWLPLGSEIAHRWALKYNYPLEDSSSLSRVAQFLEIDTGEPILPKSILSREIREKASPDFPKAAYKALPPCLIAEVKLPKYLCTRFRT